MVWSDETKINCLGSDGRKWVWKRPGKGLSNRLVEGTVKFGGGSVMIWGYMAWEGVRYAGKIDGRMNSDIYLQILMCHSLPAYLGHTSHAHAAPLTHTYLYCFWHA